MINIGVPATASVRAPSHLCQSMYAFLSDTYFFNKDVLRYYKRGFFFFLHFFLSLLFFFTFREEPQFSCKLLTWNPGTMRMQLKRIVFPSLSPFFNIKHERLQSQFSKVLMIPYYFKWGGWGGVGVVESKWIMMTAMIQTDYVIFSTVCLGLVRKGITSVKQLWIRVLNI